MNAVIRAAFLCPVLMLTSLVGAGAVSYISIDRLSSDCALGGNTVAWTSWQAGGDVLLAHDLATGQTQVVASGSAYRSYLGVSGQFVVWQQNHSGGTDILGKNLATGEDLAIAVGPGYQCDPAISGSTALWYDDVRHGIYGRDLLGGSEFPVLQDKVWGPMDFDGRTVVYQHYGDYDVTGIRGYDLVDHRQFIIGDVGTPSVSGNTVVWARDDGNGGDIFAYDIPTGTVTALTNDSASQTAATLRDDILAWTQTRRMEGDLNWDGDVDFADYAVMEVNFGWTTGKTWRDGDMDGDGDVDFADYQRLEVNYAVYDPDGQHSYARNLTTGTLFDLDSHWATWGMHVSGNRVTAGMWDRVYLLSEDGEFDFADYQLLESSYGQTVPEPLTAALLLAGAWAAVARGLTWGRFRILPARRR